MLTPRIRWEIRTRGLGCHVSTITLLTCVVSVLSTFLVMGFAVVGWRAGRWGVKRWKGRGEGWWRVWRWDCWNGWKAWRVRLVGVRGRNEEEVEGAPLIGPEG